MMSSVEWVPGELYRFLLIRLKIDPAETDFLEVAQSFIIRSVNRQSGKVLLTTGIECPIPEDVHRWQLDYPQVND